MRPVVSFLLGFLLGMAGATVALKYHWVRASDGIHRVAKTQANFADCYVDIREFGFSQWQSHPADRLIRFHQGRLSR